MHRTRPLAATSFDAHNPSCNRATLPFHTRANYSGDRTNRRRRSKSSLRTPEGSPVRLHHPARPQTLAVRGMPDRCSSHRDGIAPPATGPRQNASGTQATTTIAEAVTHRFQATQCFPFCTGVFPMHSIGRLERFQPDEAASNNGRQWHCVRPKMAQIASHEHAELLRTSANQYG